MIYIEIMGGLGNQLFQIFCGIAYSLENRVLFKINANKNDSVSPIDNISKRPTYWNNFLTNLSKFTYREQLIIPTYNESTFIYNKIPSINEDFKLRGYYQSYKYFDGQFATICNMINLDNQKVLVKEKYKQYFNNKKIICIHFRIGDYVKNQTMHPILNSDYYIKSITYLNSQLTDLSNYEILYFGEQADNTLIESFITEIKTEFKNKYTIIDFAIPDFEQLLLMSLCEHNIIANSTFSWWGAYFNTNTNKIVCYPSLWFGKHCNINTKDLFPNNWIKISI